MGGSPQECWGGYSNGIGYGPGFQYACVHSDSNDHSGGDTVWYNYTLASAGTIFDENTTESSPANNSNNATESICPKGWTLATLKQMGANRDVSSFSPVWGGHYTNGQLAAEATHGYWWTAEAPTSGANRYMLDYSTGLANNAGHRAFGFYIRCVSEEKTVTDLTYMQDMTPSITKVRDSIKTTFSVQKVLDTTIYSAYNKY